MRGLRLTSRRCAQTGQGNVISLDSPRLTALLFDLITLISSWLPSRLVSILFPHSGISHAHCPSPRLAPRNLSYLQILFAGGRRRGQRSVHHQYAQYDHEYAGESKHDVTPLDLHLGWTLGRVERTLHEQNVSATPRSSSIPCSPS
jgi:hypothetical protein